MSNYEINKNTVAVIGINDRKSRVVEYDYEKVINSNSYEVMDHSCNYFGSSYDGRVEGSKNILKSCYKLPIIVEEELDLVFFPTEAINKKECTWLNLNSIRSIKDDRKGSIVYFKNGKKIKLSISKFSVYNQILRATRLQYLLNERKCRPR